MLERILAHLDQYLAADALGRSEIIEKALQSMTNRMADFQVVGFRTEHKVELMPRTESKRLKANAADVFRYHPFMNPSSRTSAEKDIQLLLDDMRTGKLLRACEALDLAWRTTRTYSDSSRILQAHEIKLWSSPKRSYGRTRLPPIAHTFASSCALRFSWRGSWPGNRALRAAITGDVRETWREFRSRSFSSRGVRILKKIPNYSL